MALGESVSLEARDELIDLGSNMMGVASADDPLLDLAASGIGVTPVVVLLNRVTNLFGFIPGVATKGFE